MTEQIKIAGQPLTKKTLLGSLKIIIPLYLTYTIFALSIFFYFIPQLKVHMLDQKKQTILQLTNSTISLLSEINSQIQKGEITLFKAQKEAIHQIRNLKYGHEGKDYFWIIDMHPFMVMHPYQPELEGKELTQIKDTSGNYPFMAMVNTVMQHGAGYVDYQWQWKDQPQKVVHKLSYVKHFAPWDWIIGTGIYTNDILHEIGMITHKFIKIFGAILLFIIILSLYITRQIFRTEQKKYWAEEARDLEELRLKKLFELSQHSGKSIRTLTTFALEEAINLTRSEIGYLAFLNDDESQLTMHTWSEQVMAQCKIDNKIMIYNTNETGLWGEAVRARKPVIINDYENFGTLPKKGYPQGHVKMSRILSIPVFDGNRIAALAGVGNKKDNYNDSDIRQMQLMMDGMLTL